MKKVILIISAIIISLTIFSIYKVINKPPIVTIVACSDYCPKPKTEYEERIYKDVHSTIYCQLLGGRPSSYTGWKKYKICIAE